MAARDGQKPGGCHFHKESQDWSGSREDVIFRGLRTVTRLWRPSGQERCASSNGVIQLGPAERLDRQEAEGGHRHKKSWSFAHFLGRSQALDPELVD